MTLRRAQSSPTLDYLPAPAAPIVGLGISMSSSSQGSDASPRSQHVFERPLSPSYPSPLLQASPTQLSAPALGRHPTLLSTSASPNELALLLGRGSNARLRPRAQTLPRSLSVPYAPSPVPLEQARPKARVELDLRLENEVCVEGGAVRGAVEVCIREGGAWMGAGKVRVVGFEELSSPSARHVFYQHSTELARVSDGYYMLFSSTSPDSADEEGFWFAEGGQRVIPFEMPLPIAGGAKGTFKSKLGQVRYILIVSFKLKYSSTTSPTCTLTRSIAHFYRPLSIFPVLPPLLSVLAALPEPIVARAESRLFMAGSGKVSICASLERGVWVAGGKVWVTIEIANDCAKKVKSLNLTLRRTTASFRPHSSAPTDSPDACETATAHKNVSESSLAAGERAGARGRASARGWWVGVATGETTRLCHSVVVPHDALSIKRSQLLEVTYIVRVTISCGSSKGSDLSVELPVHIVSFISLDPPPGLLSIPRVSADPSFSVEMGSSGNMGLAPEWGMERVVLETASGGTKKTEAETEPDVRYEDSGGGLEMADEVGQNVDLDELEEIYDETDKQDEMEERLPTPSSFDNLPSPLLPVIPFPTEFNASPRDEPIGTPGTIPSLPSSHLSPLYGFPTPPGAQSIQARASSSEAAAGVESGPSSDSDMPASAQSSAASSVLSDGAAVSPQHLILDPDPSSSKPKSRPLPAVPPSAPPSPFKPISRSSSPIKQSSRPASPLKPTSRPPSSIIPSLPTPLVPSPTPPTVTIHSVASSGTSSARISAASSPASVYSLPLTNPTRPPLPKPTSSSSSSANSTLSVRDKVAQLERAEQERKGANAGLLVPPSRSSTMTSRRSVSVRSTQGATLEREMTVMSFKAPLFRTAGN